MLPPVRRVQSEQARVCCHCRVVYSSLELARHAEFGRHSYCNHVHVLESKQFSLSNSEDRKSTCRCTKAILYVGSQPAYTLFLVSLCKETLHVVLKEAQRMLYRRLIVLL